MGSVSFLNYWTRCLLISLIVIIVCFQDESQAHIVSKRQTTYTCTATECTNGVCTKKTYTGPHRPSWCKHGKQSWRSSYSTRCNHLGICTHKTDFSQQYHDYGRPTNQQLDTYAVTCVNKICDVKSCSGQYGCRTRGRISEAELERDIQHLPRCKDGKRKKRSFVQHLTGYCCSIAERLGKRYITIRPMGRIG